MFGLGHVLHGIQHVIVHCWMNAEQVVKSIVHHEKNDAAKEATTGKEEEATPNTSQKTETNMDSKQQEENGFVGKSKIKEDDSWIKSNGVEDESKPAIVDKQTSLHQQGIKEPVKNVDTAVTKSDGTEILVETTTAPASVTSPQENAKNLVDQQTRLENKIGQDATATDVRPMDPPKTCPPPTSETSSTVVVVPKTIVSTETTLVKAKQSTTKSNVASPAKNNESFMVDSKVSTPLQKKEVPKTDPPSNVTSTALGVIKEPAQVTPDVKRSPKRCQEQPKTPTKPSTKATKQRPCKVAAVSPSPTKLAPKFVSTVAKKKTVMAKMDSKGFKQRVIYLLERDGALDWLRTVNSNDLESLGGDTNRLYQLLVEGKGATATSLEVAVAMMDVASLRTDLFSSKQCKVFKKHKEGLKEKCFKKSNEAAKLAELRAQEAEEEKKRNQLEALYEAERQAQLAGLDDLQVMANGAPETIAPVQNVNGQYAPSLANSSISASRHVTPSQEVMKVPTSSHSLPKKSTITRPESPSYAPSEVLQAFLDKQKRCIKGSPDDFCHWLWLLGIFTVDDLATAVLNDDYLRDVLQQGNGKVGIKKFKRDVFKKAVMAAALDEKTIPEELLCPISHVLMSNDPVVAADGHTYERAAIEAWFQKQTNEIAHAKESFGSESSQARAMAERGILSPMTGTEMSHLNLTPNNVVRSLANEFAMN